MKYETYPVMTIAKIRETISEACIANGVGELANSITVEFNSRFKSRMGDARILPNEIRLSSVLFPRATPAQQYNTVVHEACHIIAIAKYGSAGKGHKRGWKACMIVAGETPERCHMVPTDFKSRVVVISRCGCLEGCIVGPIVAKRMQAGIRYHCRKCKKMLSI